MYQFCQPFLFFSFFKYVICSTNLCRMYHKEWYNDEFNNFETFYTKIVNLDERCNKIIGQK